MLVCLVVLTYLNGMVLNAQVGSCPIPTPSGFWINETSLSIGGSSFGGSINIQGSFTVNLGTFTFSGAQIAVVSASDIFVNPGCTLRIVGGTIITNAQNLWNGITVLPGGHLVIEDSEVCGAINAVYMSYSGSGSPASFDIQDSGLRFNETGILVANYSGGTYPGYVVGTHFEGGTLAAGGTYSNSFRGVYAHNVNGGTGLTVGDESTSAASNYFTRMDLGINSVNSDLNVWNNSFEDIQDYASIGYGCAVYANVNPAPSPYTLTVGTSSTRTNYMLDCRVGVFSRGMLEVNVSDNEMNRTSEPFDIGVWITRTDETIVVGGNTIRNIDDAAILLDENPGASGGPVDASVNNNTIEGNLAETRGIVVDDLVGGVTIRANSIEDVHRGIIAQSMLSASQVRIDENEVSFSFSGTSSEPAVGILAIQAATPDIYQNTITGNCPYASGGGPCTGYSVDNSRIRGIQLIKTEDARVFTNYIEYCGAGLFVYQDNFGGNAVCNEFHDCYSGVVWDDLGTGEFGRTVSGTERVYGYLSDTASSDNRWTSSVGSGFEPIRSFSINSSDANSVDWYYRNAATYDFPSLTNRKDIGPSTLLNILIGVNTDICDTLALLRESGYFDQEEESEMGSYMEYLLDDHLADEENATISSTLYAFLTKVNRVGNLIDKAVAAIAQTNIASFSTIESLWLTGNSDSALSLVQSLTPINQIESYLQDVWKMRLENVQSEIGYVWSLTEETTLLDIAYSDLEETGPAAILAQSLLGITHVPDNWIVEDIEERIAFPDLDLPKIFPNPAQSIMYVSTSLDNNLIIIHDLQGKLWKSVSLIDNNAAIKVEDLPNGLYIVRIYSSMGEVSSHKLSIAR